MISLNLKTSFTRRILFFLFLSFFLQHYAICQLHPEHKRTYNWIFGSDNTGAILYNFNNPFSNSIVPVFSANAYGQTTISDTAGNLMFSFSDGALWNKNYQFVALLNGCWNNYANVFLPVPGNDSLILIFHSAGYFESSYYGLQYSLLNAKANNGLGSIINSNTMLLPNASGSVAAACHKNGRDYWIVSADTSSFIYSWLIDSTGVPQLRHSQQIISTRTLFGTRVSRIVMAFTTMLGANLLSIISNDYENSLVTDYTVSILKFDNETGFFGNELLLESHAGIMQTGDFFAFNPSFSPSGRWLYVSFTETTVPRDGYIKRYTNLYDAQIVSDVYSEIVYSSTDKLATYTVQCSPQGNMIFYKMGTPNTLKSLYTSFILYPDSTQPVILLDAISTGSASTNTSTWAPLNNLPWQWYYRPEGFLNYPVNPLRPLIIAPNPVSKILYILNPEQKLKNVTMYDISGKAFFPEFNPLGEIYTNNLNNGIYLLRIEYGEGSVKTSKIIVQK